MQKDGVAFKQHAEAFYSPARDEIYLPPRESFKSQEGYYGTALHEIGHATGAAQRLNRDGISGGHKFGSEGYAKEELRAELFSVFMAAETGIPHDEEQHKAYIQSWAKVLKEDKNEIFRATSEASKAVDYVLDKERSLEMTRDHDMESKVEAVDMLPSEPSMFWAKVNNAAEMADLGKNGSDGLSKVRIGHQIRLTTEEYDKMTDDLLASNPHIAGLGGTEGPNENGEYITHVAEVTAPDRQRLHIDPEGYSYLRYVGIPESDIDAFLARGSFKLNIDQKHAQDAVHDQAPQQREDANGQLILREAMEDAGWKFKPTGAYEKTFLLAKDQNKGGEFTHGKSEVEKIMVAKTTTEHGLVIEHGWNDIPVQGTIDVAPKDAVRLLDAAAKDYLANQYADLGVRAVRGANEPARPQSEAGLEPLSRDEIKPGFDLVDNQGRMTRVIDVQHNEQATTTTERDLDTDELITNIYRDGDKILAPTLSIKAVMREQQAAVEKEGNDVVVRGAEPMRPRQRIVSKSAEMER